MASSILWLKAMRAGKLRAMRGSCSLIKSVAAAFGSGGGESVLNALSMTTLAHEVAALEIEDLVGTVGWGGVPAGSRNACLPGAQLQWRGRQESGEEVLVPILERPILERPFLTRPFLERPNLEPTNPRHDQS
jgi:hypothetical protein